MKQISYCKDDKLSEEFLEYLRISNLASGRGYLTPEEMLECGAIVYLTRWQRLRLAVNLVWSFVFWP